MPLNYVERKRVDSRMVSNLSRDKHLVVYGSSKQGKTSLRRHCLQSSDYVEIHCTNKMALRDLNAAILKAAGYTLAQSQSISTSGRNKIVASIAAAFLGTGVSIAGEKEETLSKTVNTCSIELEMEDVNDIIRALEEIDFHKYIVLEDFHYLPIEVQKEFSVQLKAFHEADSAEQICFIIVAVWLEGDRLLVYNGDLTGRVVSISADRWYAEELRSVISQGEALLNIVFTEGFKIDLIDRCVDSVFIVQEACELACEKAGLVATHEGKEPLEIGSGLKVKDLLRIIVDQQKGRCNEFIHNFSSGFQDTELQMYRWIMYCVVSEETEKLEMGLKYGELKRKILSMH